MEELFQAMLEYLIAEDRENAIYTLRELADSLEEGDSITAEEVIDVISNI